MTGRARKGVCLCNHWLALCGRGAYTGSCWPEGGSGVNGGGFFHSSFNVFVLARWLVQGEAKVEVIILAGVVVSYSRKPWERLG